MIKTLGWIAVIGAAYYFYTELQKCKVEKNNVTVKN